MIPSPWRSTLAAAAVYVAAAVALTWPLAASMTTHLGALQGPGDPYLNLWILGWGLEAWTHDPLGVLTGRVFDANIFHPAEGTLAYSDHFLLQSLALAPLYALTSNSVICYNVLLLSSIAASGLAMHALARAVTGSAAAAYAAGLAWACWPYRTAHLLHIQLQALYFLPLAILCLHHVVARRRWRDAVALGVVAALQAVASVYYGVMTAVVLVIAAFTLAIATGQWRSRRLWLRLAGAALIALVVSAPGLAPYMRTQQNEGFGRTLAEAVHHSASWQSYSQVPPSNLIYGSVLGPRLPRPGARDRHHVEHQMFPGVVLLTLAILGLRRNVGSDARPLALSSLSLVLAGVLLSMGPDGVRPLYAALHDGVFGFQAIRAPARFGVITLAGTALLAALGMRWVTKRWPSRALAVVVLSALGLEYLNRPLGFAPAPPPQTPVGQWLADEPTAGAVVYLPLSFDIENTPFMVQSLEHRRPIVNGYSGQRPAFYSALVDSLADFPSPTALAALREVDVRFVVSPEPVVDAGHEKSPLVERARLGEATIYEVRWTPAAIAALEAIEAPAPPAPGPAPFHAGESATYDVFWEGGPVNLAAGTATLRVLEGGDGQERWRFEARADTARWVSNFFQARDRFATLADRQILPLEHTREIREGRRVFDRTYVFDRQSRHVRVGATPSEAAATDAMTLPLSPAEARDAVTALYYVRTLALTPGSMIAVPINEAGANMVLHVPVGTVERITHAGRPVAAVRLEPRLMRRIERRRPLALTVWLSDDERRIPLRIVVEAGFGRVRAELTDYTQ